MSVRITTLLGAGSTLDLVRSDEVITPTSGKIHDAILELKSQTLNLGMYPVLKEIHDKVVEVLRTVGSEEFKKVFPVDSLNFEELLHAVEMCYAYSSCWRNEYLHPGAYPEFGALIEPLEPIKKFQTIDFYHALDKAIKRIMEIVHAYDDDFVRHVGDNCWFVDFWRNHKGWDVFNLNYDSVVEQSLDVYNDGFVPIGENPEVAHFAPDMYLNNPQHLPTVSHLHGSIYFSEYHIPEFNYSHSHRDLYRCLNYEVAERERKVVQCSPQTQAKEQYLASPIITGLHKTDKITFAPFNFYHANFANRICANNALLIVGYSFGDLYLNQLLERITLIHGSKARVVLIDYMPQYIHDYYGIVRKISSNGHYTEFVSRMIQHNPLVWAKPITGENEPPMKFESWYKPIRSKTGILMMFICGFKNAVTMHGEEIMDFLNS